VSPQSPLSSPELARARPSSPELARAPPAHGLYNLLVYEFWGAYLPHTRKIVRPMERALSYTLGHKPGESCCRVDERGRVLNDVGEVPAVVHQYSKGAAGRKLQRTKFYERYLSVAG
jgi:hypothetical protein